MIVQRPMQQNIFANQRLMNMALESSPSQENLPGAELENYSVVVADDDATMAVLLATHLRRLGHQVVGVAANGREAVEMTLQFRPDVLVMDVNMPVMDGLQASREILGHFLIPIVLSTGMTDSRTLHSAVDLNVTSYLVKPFSPAQLKVAIHLAVAQCRLVAPPAPLRAVSWGPTVL